VTCRGPIFVLSRYAFKRIHIGNQAEINRESTMTTRFIYG